MDHAVPRPAQASVAAVPGGGSVRGGPPRGDRAGGDAGAVAAGAGRHVPRTGGRAADARPRRLDACPASLAPCGRETAGGGGGGGGGGGCVAGGGGGGPAR